MVSIKKIAVLGFAIAAAAAAAAAAQPGPQHEDIPRAEIAVDYSYMRANATPGECGCFNLNGGNAEAAFRAYRGLSAVFDLTGEHAGTTSVPNQSLSLLSYTGGPRFSYPVRRSERTGITPFVQGLIGGVHGFDALFPHGSGNLLSSANALAVFVGGGVDIAISRSFAVRAVQVDYGLNHLPNNANNSENLLRVSTGIVFRVR